MHNNQMDVKLVYSEHTIYHVHSRIEHNHSNGTEAPASCSFSLLLYDQPLSLQQILEPMNAYKIATFGYSSVIVNGESTPLSTASEQQQ